MSERKEELYTSKLPAGKRTYFFDVKEAVNSRRYLTITESKRVRQSDFERHSIMVFAEDALAFNEEIGKAIRWIFDSTAAGPAAGSEAGCDPDWSEDDEQALRREFIRLGEHCSVEQLATLLQRRASDVRTKLEEMGLL